MKLAPLLLLPALLLAGAGCSKKETAGPSKTALLTGPTWRLADARLTINGVEGVYTPPTSDQNDYKFAADGKYTNTSVVGGVVRTGTWKFASNETQLVLTPGSGSAPDPFQLPTLTSTDLSLANSYTQAQVQQAMNNNNTSPTSTELTIRGLLLASGVFKFPNNTVPVSSTTQITSLTYSVTHKAR